MIHKCDRYNNGDFTLKICICIYLLRSNGYPNSSVYIANKGFSIISVQGKLTEDDTIHRLIMVSDLFNGLQFGSDIEVHYTLENEEDSKAWFPATAISLNYLHEDRGEVLKGIIQYKAVA